MQLAPWAVQAIGVVARSRFVRNVATTLAVQGASLVFSLVNAALVARLLGLEGKGVFTMALMVPGVLAMLLNGGVGIANVHLVGSGQLSLPQASRASVSFLVLASVAGAIISGALAVSGWLRAVVPGMPTGVQLVAMALLPLIILDGYLSALFLGLQRISALNVVTAVGGGCNVLAVALFVGVWRWGLVGAVGAPLMGALVSVALKCALLGRMGASFRPSRDLMAMRRMLGFGVKGQIGNLLQFFNYRLDTFILNYFRGPSAVGIYSSAVATAELLWQFPNAVSLVITAKAAATQPTVLNAFAPRVLKGTLALSFAGGVVLALGGRTFIEWVYSSAFAAAYAPLLGLLPGVVLLGGAKVLANELAGRGYPHYNSAVSAMALVVTLLLDVLLIPRWGAMGAAAASSVAYASSFFLSMTLHRTVVRKSTSAVP